jgi:hypothetical protein
MRKQKPYKILEERLNCHFIAIEFFKRRNTFSFSLSTFIGDGGVGRPEQGSFNSFFEARNTALHYIKRYHKSPSQQSLLRKFRLMDDLDQPLLFDDP